MVTNRDNYRKYDKSPEKMPIINFVLGGTQQHKLDGMPKSENKRITANEIKSYKRTYNDLEFVSAACYTAYGNVLYNVISPRAFIAHEGLCNVHCAMAGMSYVVARAYGWSIDDSKNLVRNKKFDGLVVY